MSTTTKRLFGISEKNRRRASYALNCCALLSVPVLEMALDHYLFSGQPGALGDFLAFKGCWFYPLVFYIAALLFLLRAGLCIVGIVKWCRAKKRQALGKQARGHRLRDQLIPLLKSIVSLDPADIIATLLFLIHLTWIPDSLFDFVKEANTYCLLHPFIFTAGFLCILCFAAQQERRDTSKQTVLFTGLSNLSLSSLMPFFRPLAEQFRDIREVVVFFDKDMGAGKTKMPNNEWLDLLPCYDALVGDTLTDDDRTRLKKDYVLSKEKLKECGISREALVELEGDSGFTHKMIEEKLASLTLFLEVTCAACLGDEVTVELVPCDYSDDANVLVDEIKGVVKRRVWPQGIHEDEELLFNLTPGMASISVALAFNAAAFSATRGTRKSCYIEQKEKRIRTYSLENIE